MATIDRIEDGLYRVSTFDGRIGLTFNQYLVEDEQPTLVHSGSSQLFGGVVASVRQIIDPSRLAYVFVSHFESDECGALAQWQSVAPSVIPICSAVTARQLAGFGINDHALVKQEGDVLPLGHHRLSFVTYPSEMHLWDGLVAFDESGQVLFSSDLFIQRGLPSAPIVQADAARVLDIPVRSIPNAEMRETCLAKIKALGPKLIAPGHGPVYDLRTAGT